MKESGFLGKLAKQLGRSADKFAWSGFEQCAALTPRGEGQDARNQIHSRSYGSRGIVRDATADFSETRLGQIVAPRIRTKFNQAPMVTPRSAKQAAFVQYAG